MKNKLLTNKFIRSTIAASGLCWYIQADRWTCQTAIFMTHFDVSSFSSNGVFYLHYGIFCVYLSRKYSRTIRNDLASKLTMRFSYSHLCYYFCFGFGFFLSQNMVSLLFLWMSTNSININFLLFCFIHITQYTRQEQTIFENILSL